MKEENSLLVISLFVATAAAVVSCAVLGTRLYSTGGGDRVSRLRETWTDVKRDAIAMSGRGPMILFPNRSRGGEEEEEQRGIRHCSTECRCSTGGINYYGRFCGYGYTGCEGYGPCDRLDACCMAHDACVTAGGMTNCDCAVALVKCAMCALAAGNADGPWKCEGFHEAGITLEADMIWLLKQCFDRAEGEVVKALLSAGGGMHC